MLSIVECTSVSRILKVAFLFCLFAFGLTVVSRDANSQIIKDFEHGWVFCSPIQLDNTSNQFIPAAYVLNFESVIDPLTMTAYGLNFYESEGYENICGDREYTGGAVSAIVARNMVSGQQRILFKNLAGNPPIPRNMIEDIHYPSKDCASGVGPLPCGFILVLMKNNDTNGDNSIGKEDAIVAHLIDATSASVMQVTDSNTTVLRYYWMPESARIIFSVRGDVNGDKLYSQIDGEEIIEFAYYGTTPVGPVIQPVIRNELHRLRPIQ